MRPYVLIAYVFLLSALGCTTSDPPPVIKPGTCYLLSITEILNTLPIVTQIEYDSLNRVARYSSTYNGATTFASTFSYGSNGLVESETRHDGSVGTYTYDASNQLEQVAYNTPALNVITFKHNSHGQLTGRVVKTGATVFNYTYAYPNTSSHNCSEEVSWDASYPQAFYRTMEYDNMKNPMKELSIPYVSFKPYRIPAGANNATKSSESSTKELRTYTYQYNDMGYPTVIKEVWQIGSSTVTYQYLLNYTCKEL